jgi:SNF2 family DNA or RNA helicase
VDNFQQNPDIPVMLISLKAGGVGLNLTAADYVVLFDPWWNPAAEQQAADRAHRIGQTRPVFVYRLIAEDSVEERVMELQQAKQELFEAIITTGPAALGRMGKEEIGRLFGSRADTSIANGGIIV